MLQYIKQLGGGFGRSLVNVAVGPLQQLLRIALIFPVLMVAHCGMPIVGRLNPVPEYWLQLRELSIVVA